MLFFNGITLPFSQMLFPYLNHYWNQQQTRIIILSPPFNFNYKILV